MPEESPVRILDRRREAGPAPRVPSALERHIQTVLVTLMCGILAWMGHKVTTTAETLSALRAENSVQIATLEQELRRLEQGISRSYSAQEAMRDMGYRDASINAIEERVRYLERLLNLSSTPWMISLPEKREGPRRPVQGDQ